MPNILKCCHLLSFVKKYRILYTTTTTFRLQLKMYPRHVHTTILLSLICFIEDSGAIHIYRSSNVSNIDLNGLVLQTKIETDLAQGVTLCGRFYYTRIITSSSVPFYAVSQSYKYFWARMGYHETFWGFADFNWILMDPIQSTFRIWAANRWHHICVALDKSIKHFVVVKDGFVTSINVTIADWDLSDINSQFLSGLHVGESDSYKQLSCVNAWDYALSIDDMKDWTGCR